jgi:Mrp family chromosome partitioning ATPase
VSTEEAQSSSPTTSLRDHLRILYRRKFIVVGALIAAVVAAGLMSFSMTPQYRASAELMYEKQIDITNPFQGSSYTDPTVMNRELQSVPAIIASPAMTQRAARLLGVAPSDKLAKRVSVTVSPDNNVFTIAAVDANPKTATAIANAYATAFTDWRKEITEASVGRAIAVVKQNLSNYTPTQASTSPDYAVLEQELRELQIMAATTTGNYRIISAATVPPAPFSPKHKRDVALGLILGLVVGVGLAFAAEQLDTRVRDHAEVAAAVQLPVVGRVPKVAQKSIDQPGAGVLVLSADEHALGEALRKVRTNLDFLSVGGDLTSMAVTSCVQGEGKSLTIANLAVTLALAGKKVVLIDADLRRPRLHRYFGLANKVGLSTVLAGQTKLVDALQPVDLRAWASDNGKGASPQGAGENAEAAGATLASTVTSACKLLVLTSGPLPPNPGELLASERFAALLAEIKASSADTILADTSAFIPVGDAASVAAQVDGLLLLVNLQKATRPMLREAQEFLQLLPCRKLGVIAVAERDGEAGYYRSRYKYKYSEAI